MLQPLLAAFWRIVLLRSGPDSLPAQPVLLLLLLIFYALLSVLHALLSSDPSWLVLTLQAFDALLLCALSWSVLHFKGLSSRFLQTLCALLGAGVVFGLLGLPVAVFGNVIEAESEFYVFWVFGALALLAWELTVRGFIFYRAFAVGPVLANVMSFTIFVALLAVSQWLVPAAVQ